MNIIKYTQGIEYVSSKTKSEIISGMSLITASLRQGKFIFSTPSDSDVAHIIYNGCVSDRENNNGERRMAPQYLVQFFKKISSEDLISRGYFHISPREVSTLEKIST